MGAPSLLTKEIAVVFFDTHCILCNRTVQFLLKIDKKHQLKFAGLGSRLGKEFLEKYAITEDSVLLFYKKSCYSKSKAFFVLSRILGFPYSLFIVFQIIPRSLADRIYDWIARNRFSWFGTTEQCLIPEKKHSGRIIL